LMIEPTETESLEELDAFIEAMLAIDREAAADPVRVRGAPYTTPVGRIDEGKAGRDLDVRWRPPGSPAPAAAGESPPIPAPPRDVAATRETP
jgi:glycine cleavage system protein P-like pyridoxal-binding family